jgi:hypothetical protein
MFNNKRGLSTVVTTLIIILLVLVAIGIIWVVVRGVIEQGSAQVDVSSACPLIDLKIKSNTTACSGPGSCTLTLQRGSGGDDFDGVTVVVSNSTASNRTDVSGNIQVLSTAVINVGWIQGATKAAATPYFKDTNGKIQLCPNFHEYKLN